MSIKTYIFEVGDKVIELSAKEAKELSDDLNVIFSDGYTLWQKNRDVYKDRPIGPQDTYFEFKKHVPNIGDGDGDIFTMKNKDVYKLKDDQIPTYGAVKKKKFLSIKITDDNDDEKDENISSDNSISLQTILKKMKEFPHLFFSRIKYADDIGNKHKPKENDDTSDFIDPTIPPPMLRCNQQSSGTPVIDPHYHPHSPSPISY